MRHRKVLDALGDLVTLGMPLMGHVVLHRAGHDLMNRLVHKIIDSPDRYRHIELGADIPDSYHASTSHSIFESSFDRTWRWRYTLSSKSH